MSNTRLQRPGWALGTHDQHQQEKADGREGEGLTSHWWQAAGHTDQEQGQATAAHNGDRPVRDYMRRWRHHALCVSHNGTRRAGQ